VSVFEQSQSLRAGGLAFHLWSNPTSLLPTLNIPASRIPGEPLNRMLVRAAVRKIVHGPVPGRAAACHRGARRGAHRAGDHGTARDHLLRRPLC
jgi:hypothetical protein